MQRNTQNSLVRPCRSHLIINVFFFRIEDIIVMNYVACYSESIIKGIISIIAGIFPFKIVQRKSSPLVRN